MKKIIAIVTGVLIALGVTAVPAQASSERTCLTSKQLTKAVPGQSPAQTRKALKMKGFREVVMVTTIEPTDDPSLPASYDIREVVRIYQKCGTHGNAARKFFSVYWSDFGPADAAGYVVPTGQGLRLVDTGTNAFGTSFWDSTRKAG